MRYRLTLLALLLIASIGYVAAQTVSWSAWLYNRETGHLIVAQSDGTQRYDVQLPTLMAHDMYSSHADVSPDGRLTAYSVSSSTQNTRQFVVVDTDQLAASGGGSGAFELTFSPPQPTLQDTFVFENDVFNDDGTAVAYGYGLDPEGWEIVVLDIATGSTMFTLRSSDPQMSALMPDDFFLVPAIQQYTGGSVYFTLVNWATEGRPEYSNFRWSLVTNSVSESIAYPTLGGDTLESTGEIIMPMYDPALPNQSELMMMGVQINTLQVYDPPTDLRFPVFTTPEWNMHAAEFVNNGRYVMVFSSDMVSDSQFWSLLERDGNVVSQMFLPTQHAYDVVGTPRGYLMRGVETRADGDYVFVDYAEAPNLTVRNRGFTVPTPGAEYIIVHVDAVADGPFIYGNWSTVGDAVTPEGTPLFEGGPFFEDTPAAQDAATPVTASDPLIVGGIAFIQTTEGDMLNVRSGPGLNFQRVTQLAPGTQVTLLEGPVPADGFTWWRVEMPDGRSGWVVQRADNVDTLLPAGS